MVQQKLDAQVITVPAFASHGSGIGHFFGTRRHAKSFEFEPGIPVQSAEGTRPPSWLLSVKQIHGTEALVVDRALTSDDRFLDGWDGLVTNQPGVMVAVRTADCVPVLIHDPIRRVVAAVHAGWRGAVAGIVPKTISLMGARFGSAPNQLRVSIGPSAGVCCYEVDEPVLAALRRVFSGWKEVIRGKRGGKAYLDLKTLIRAQAEEAGSIHASITTVNLCTICHEDLFFSYRRDGRVNGTMVNAIGLTPL